jgi:hypothetical protein
MFILVLAVSACNKEKDEPDTRTALQEVSITLHFNTDYNDSTEYDSRSRSAQGMRSRYTIYAYETTQTGRSTVRATDVPTYTYSKVLDKASYDNFTTTIELSPGKWELFVWYDNIDTESGYTYYDCSNVFSISVNTTDVYRGNDNYREAFCGSADISIDDNPESINITMQRPLAKIEFISNDLDQFIESQGENIDLGRYTVRFYYTGYLPTMFNMLTDRPSDSSSNIYFDGSIERISNKEAVIGFDHVFVSEQGSSVPVIVAVYDKNGNQITVSPTYNVALVRNGITIVTGKFLSSSSGYGPVINAEYTGTYNIVF